MNSSYIYIFFFFRSFTEYRIRCDDIFLLPRVPRYELYGPQQSGVTFIPCYPAAHPALLEVISSSSVSRSAIHVLGILHRIIQRLCVSFTILGYHPIVPGIIHYSQVSSDPLFFGSIHQSSIIQYIFFFLDIPQV